MRKFILSALLLLISFGKEALSQTSLLHPPPIPNFYITGLCFGDSTRFINKTEFALISWAIMNDKGDTIYKAKGENTAYYFKKRGFYDVCLIADNGHIATKTRTVRVDTITKADFLYRRCYNEFDNLSTCSNQFIWMLPDNVTAIDTFAKYQFKHAGTYPVKLIAKKGHKADTIVKMITVTADSVGIPLSLFTFRKTGASASTFEFKAADSLANQYNWFFGDRQFDDTSGYKVTHEIILSKYEPPVSLKVTNGCGYAFYDIDPFEATNISEPDFSDLKVNIYPNPVKDAFTLYVDNLGPGKSISVKLIDVNGRTIQEYSPVISSSAYSLKCSTSQIARGLYLLQIMVNGQLLNRKIIVQ